MTATAFVTLAGSARSPVPGAVRERAVEATNPIDVSLYLRPRAPVPSPESVPPMTRDAFAAAYGANPADIDAVARFASAHGLTVTERDVGRRLVRLSGAYGDFQKAFDIDLAHYRLGQVSYRGRNGSIGLHPDIADIVLSVVGFDERPAATPKIRPLTQEAAATFTGQDLAKLYGFPDGTGQGQTIGLIELGGGFRQADLDTYFKALGVSPQVTTASVDGGKNVPSGDLDGPDGEVVLDIEVAGAVAPQAKIVVYFAPNTDQGFLDAVTQAIHDKTNAPSIVSISWGSAESQWTAQAMQTMSQAFQDAGVLGVTVCVAAGDGGSSDGATDGLAHADFPASSPYALACGGTRLTAGNGKITAETVWNDTGGGATGGGISDVFALPSYQADAEIPPSANPGRRVGRGLPDVSGDADPATGYRIEGDGQSSIFGGTSAVAPLWAGLIAILNQKLGKPVGFVHPLLYKNPGAFRDITSGTNGAYSAKAGWDACTGLGSPNGTALLTALSAGSTPQS